MQKLARVSSKGQVVIPAEIRRKLGRPRAVIIRESEGRIILEPAVTFEDAFGSGGKDTAEIAAEISRNRRREVESERA